MPEWLYWKLLFLILNQDFGVDDYSRSSNDDEDVEPAGPRISAEEKRSALLTVALEHNLINLLTGCVTHWNDGDLHFLCFLTFKNVTLCIF